MTEKKVNMILEGLVKYTGEMSGAIRHGKSTQFEPDGSRFDGFFI